MGTNLEASIEASAPPGTDKQASCEAKNLASLEAKYHRKQARSCGANLASGEAGILPSSDLKKAIFKAKYHAGTAPSGGAKYLASCEATAPSLCTLWWC